nr:hypothetical protein HK105_006584 [Polyrhizophydium stewartii]
MEALFERVFDGTEHDFPAEARLAASVAEAQAAVDAIAASIEAWDSVRALLLRIDASLTEKWQKFQHLNPSHSLADESDPASAEILATLTEIELLYKHARSLQPTLPRFPIPPARKVTGSKKTLVGRFVVQTHDRTIQDIGRLVYDIRAVQSHVSHTLSAQRYQHKEASADLKLIKTRLNAERTRILQTAVLARDRERARRTEISSDLTLSFDAGLDDDLPPPYSPPGYDVVGSPILSRPASPVPLMHSSPHPLPRSPPQSPILSQVLPGQPQLDSEPIRLHEDHITPSRPASPDFAAALAWLHSDFPATAGSASSSMYMLAPIPISSLTNHGEPIGSVDAAASVSTGGADDSADRSGNLPRLPTVSRDSLDDRPPRPRSNSSIVESSSSLSMIMFHTRRSSTSSVRRTLGSTAAATDGDRREARDLKSTRLDPGSRVPAGSALSDLPDDHTNDGDMSEEFDEGELSSAGAAAGAPGVSDTALSPFLVGLRDGGIPARRPSLRLGRGVPAPSLTMQNGKHASFVARVGIASGTVDRRVGGGGNNQVHDSNANNRDNYEDDDGDDDDDDDNDDEDDDDDNPIGLLLQRQRHRAGSSASAGLPIAYLDASTFARHPTSTSIHAPGLQNHGLGAAIGAPLSSSSSLPLFLTGGESPRSDFFARAMSQVSVPVAVSRPSTSSNLSPPSTPVSDVAARGRGGEIAAAVASPRRMIMRRRSVSLERVQVATSGITREAVTPGLAAMATLTRRPRRATTPVLDGRQELAPPMAPLPQEMAADGDS